MASGLSDILSKNLGLAVKSIGQNMDKEDFNASGGTKQSLMFEVYATPSSIKGVITSLSPILYSEKGKGPRLETRGLADAIYEWMPYRGIGDNLTDAARYNLAGVIARRISRLGTKLWREKGSKGQRREIYTNVLDKTVEDVGEQLTAFLSTTIKATFRETFAKV